MPCAAKKHRFSHFLYVNTNFETDSKDNCGKSMRFGPKTPRYRAGKAAFWAAAACVFILSTNFLDLILKFNDVVPVILVFLANLERSCHSTVQLNREQFLRVDQAKKIKFSMFSY